MVPSFRLISNVTFCCGLTLLLRPIDAVDLRTIEIQTLRINPFQNWSGNTPMPTRLLRWILSKLAATTAFTPSNRVPLAAQSRLEPVPYSCPAMTIKGTLFFLVANRRVENRQLFPARMVDGHPALHSRNHQILDSYIRERAARHDAVVTSPAAITIEINRLNSAI